MTTSSPSRNRDLSGYGPFALLSSALGRGWPCGGARLIVPENGGGRGGPDYNQTSAHLLPEALRKVQEGNTVLQSFPRQATPRASHGETQPPRHRRTHP